MDTLTDGGLPTGTISQVFGEKALGKSILCFQAACSVVAAGRSAIIFDTEQSYFSYLVKYRLPGMNKRFGKEIPVREAKLEKVPKPSGKRKVVSRSELVTILSDTLARAGVAYSEGQISSVGDILSPEFDIKIDTPDEPSVLIVQMPDIMELLRLHGVDAELHVSEKSKNPRVELRLRSTPVYESALYKMVEQTRAKLLVYDSLSAPLKAAFPNTQDLPARSSSMAMMLSHAQRLCIQFDLGILTTSHVTISPIEEWDRRPYGGIILGHDAKFSFELTKGTATRNSKGTTTLVNPDDRPEDDRKAAEGRLVWVQRHPAMADYSEYGYSALDEEGFH